MKTDTGSDVRQLGEMLRRIEAAENAGNSSEMISMLADDAVIMAPNQPVQEGKPACAVFLTNVIKGLFDQYDRHIVYASAEVRIIGDMAFDRGSFSFRVAPRSGGAASRETGKYLFLYSRVADGTWKIARSIVNLDDEADPLNAASLHDFATRYTAAWCSHDAASVASFYADNGSLTINGGTPSIGRSAVAAAAQEFITAFPDIVVMLDGVAIDHGRVTYQWTFTGTNLGPEGTGKAVRISGYERWRIGAGGLIAESTGHFDEADYRRQLQNGVAAGQ
jgi:steroid delta-isomerase-like uncharacterized protein